MVALTDDTGNLCSNLQYREIFYEAPDIENLSVMSHITGTKNFTFSQLLA